MAGYGAWALRQRNATLLPAAQRETEAYARALSLALEYGFRDQALEGLQDIINEISRVPSVYGILVYDRQGRPLIVSDPMRTPASAPRDVLDRVLQHGETVSFGREIEQTSVYSVLRPIRDRQASVTGVLEVAQPLSLVELERANTTQRFVLNTLTLLVALTGATLWLVHRFVARPLRRLVNAVRALERGELTHRVTPDTGRSELVEVAREFNRMAGRLEAARADVIREAHERVALERRLRQSEKLAAIGNVSAGLAHQIAAPLNVISGRAEMLLKRPEADAEQARHLGIIVDQIGRISPPARRLLDFSRHREPRLQPVEVDALVGEAVELLDPELARLGIALERVGPPVSVRGDPVLLHQVFVNLLMNAIEALEGAEKERRITVRSGLLSPSEVAVEIEDPGPGIASHVKSKIFEPFVTTKTGGTGLGLAIARTIVEEHGGSLEAVTVQDSAGTVFRLTLPAAMETPDA